MEDTLCAPMAESSLLILYGSQTGNSRMIAKELGDEAKTRGYPARVHGMEDFKKFDFEDEPTIVVVTSSTGNGDAPENAEKFHRFMKKKTSPSVFTATRFAVCALGDSNYEEFCAIGKDFDKHFERLGGTRFLKRCDVDEVDGIEAHVDPWRERLWEALKALPPPITVKAAPAKADSLTPTAAGLPPTPAPAPSGAAAAEEDEAEAVGSSASRPLLAPVVAARWLTSPLESETVDPRRVLHLELDVSGGSRRMLAFEPGDALGVVPENEPAEVTALLSQLGLDGAKPLEIESAPAHLRPR